MVGVGDVVGGVVAHEGGGGLASFDAAIVG